MPFLLQKSQTSSYCAFASGCPHAPIIALYSFTGVYISSSLIASVSLSAPFKASASSNSKSTRNCAKSLICTKCGKEFDAATKFCGECGGKVTEKKSVEEIAPVWICTQCGKEFDAATKFCGECGGKVTEKNCQKKIDWQTEIKKHKSYQPEKALELLSDWITKENKRKFQRKIDIDSRIYLFCETM